MLDLVLLFVAIACWAFVWVRILPSEGHMLAPVQHSWRDWYRARYGTELDGAWWWRPLWGCPGCHAGQLAFWIYLLRFFHHYDPLLHLCAVGVAIVTACLLTLRWNQAN
jgi:hypothetical protein